MLRHIFQKEQPQSWKLIDGNMLIIFFSYLIIFCGLDVWGYLPFCRVDNQYLFNFGVSV